ncbi:UNVERIFIED_CONTAM: hypothetical protein Scaly_1065700 [Sesamum calycinum]|uniref:Uncharacterized protein n=1 Tax=Sesamum calycinum TaxID=2727403 RepID=A0AAW2QMB9_9LAMI
MGYIYEVMDRAKEAIATSFSNVERSINSFLRSFMVDGQLHRPLHVAGYYLNPEFCYSNPSVEQDKEVIRRLFKCIERLIPSGEVKIVSNGDDDDENARVFEDDDLTWDNMTRAFGADEDAYAFRPYIRKN